MAKKKAKEKDIIGFEIKKEKKLKDISDIITDICKEDIKRAKEEGREED